MRAFGTDRKTSEAEGDRIDRMRSAYVGDWYGIRFGDPTNYDLCIDTSRFDEVRCAAIIVSAVRARASR